MSVEVNMYFVVLELELELELELKLELELEQELTVYLLTARRIPSGPFIDNAWSGFFSHSIYMYMQL